MSKKEKERTQKAFLTIGDEFLLQYFLSAHKEFRGTLILSRLFHMGHSLELYAKSSLTQSDGTTKTGHEIDKLLKLVDSSLALSNNAMVTGKSLFNSSVTNIDLGVWFKLQEEMELYQAIMYLKDLKYYLKRDGNNIYPVRMSLKPINEMYLGWVKKIRNSIKIDKQEINNTLLDSVGKLGFEENPAFKVVK